MMRASVMVAAVAAMVWAGMARAQDPQGGSGDVPRGTAPPPGARASPDGSTVRGDARVAPGTGGSGGVSTQDTSASSWKLIGVSVLAGAGVEGYTGSLAPRVAVGPAWNLLIGFRPSSVFGIELAYVGAVNSLKFANFGLATLGGADIVRNGGHVAVTFGLGPWRVQPFVLAGVGVTHYSVSQNAKDVGFSSTTAGYIPVGGGIRGQIENLTVDLRGTWSLPFSDNLFPGGTGKDTLGLSTGNYGRWNATLNVGATF